MNGARPPSPRWRRHLLAEASRYRRGALVAARFGRITHACEAQATADRLIRAAGTKPTHPEHEDTPTHGR
jgi:hypothetical protein